MNNSANASLRGLAAAAAGAATTELITAALGERSFVDAAGQLVVDHSPRPVVERTVELLRTADKPVVRAAVIGVVLGSGALLGRAPRRAVRDSTAMGGLAAAGVLASLRGPTDHGPGGTLVAAVGGTLAAIGTLAAPSGWNRTAGAAGTVGLLLALRGHAARRTRQNAVHAARPLRAASPLPPARDGAEHWRGVSPLLTPVPDFYVTDVAMRPPTVDLRRWRLQVTGQVRRPMSLCYDDLVAGDLVEFDAAMVCIHNRLGWDRLGNQRWTGLPLAPLLATAEPIESAALLVTRSVDGWDCSLPISLLAELDAYVVLGMGGRPLTAAHGFPARVFVPGLFGQYTGAKWLTELRLQSEPNQDYWMPRGWPRDPALVRPLSRIDAPTHRSHCHAGPLTVTGVAWAPPGGVQAVQIAVDDQHWTDAQLADELAPAAWRRWRATVSLSPGEHDLRSRSIARDGTTQDATPRAPFPTGTTGHHRITVLAT